MDLSAETLFSDIEIAVLEDFAKDHKLPPPDNIGQAVLTTTMLGGCLGFKRKRCAGPATKYGGKATVDYLPVAGAYLGDRATGRASTRARRLPTVEVGLSASTTRSNVERDPLRPTSRSLLRGARAS